MDLKTTYLGLKLKNPLITGASPMVEDLDVVRRLEDAGVAALTMHSLFEEQISGANMDSIYHMELYADSFSEALSYFPSNRNFAFGPEEYLEQIARIKRAVAIPVIASLNGSTLGGWTNYAKQIERAGADALELNVYDVCTDPNQTGEQLENRVMDVTRAVREAVKIPLCVKLSPFFSSLPNVCARLDELGADGIVLFNRFYQPDIDLDALEAVPKLQLSDSGELALRLRWLAIVTPHLQCSAAISGGVHNPTDVIKSLMCGASAVQLVSCLLRHGPEHVARLIDGVVEWMEVNQYSSVRMMQGAMSLNRCPAPHAYERANYMRVLQSWKAVNR
jgi:dihydroorotate dehydrogenase (fumarate)